MIAVTKREGPADRSVGIRRVFRARRKCQANLDRNDSQHYSPHPYLHPKKACSLYYVPESIIEVCRVMSITFGRPAGLGLNMVRKREPVFPKRYRSNKEMISDPLQSDRIMIERGAATGPSPDVQLAGEIKPGCTFKFSATGGGTSLSRSGRLASSG